MGRLRAAHVLYPGQGQLGQGARAAAAHSPLRRPRKATATTSYHLITDAQVVGEAQPPTPSQERPGHLSAGADLWRPLSPHQEGS